MPVACLATAGFLGISASNALGAQTLPPGFVPDPGLAAQANDAGAALQAAGDKVAEAQQAADKAGDQLPGVQHDLDVANAAAAAAKQAAAAAEAAVGEAQAQVAAQQAKVAASSAQIDAVRSKIAAFARQAYMTGGQVPGEVEILLGSRTPSSFARGIEIEKRAARGNNNVLGALAAAIKVQRHELATLHDIEAAAAAKQAAADQQTQIANAAAEDAAAKQKAVADLVAQREAQLASVQKQRASVKALYEQLLAQQQAELQAAIKKQRQADKLAKQKAAEEAAKAAKDAANQGKPAPAPTTIKPVVGTGGFVTTVGTGRSAKAAVDWALSMVGNGRDYNNQCLRFVDDAYAVTHGRMPTAISQWQRAVANGYGHPGDRTPPIGAQVFWNTSNPARHIAIYAGGGMIISTSAFNGNAVGFVPWKTMDSWGAYLGWASPYYP